MLKIKSQAQAHEKLREAIARTDSKTRERNSAAEKLHAANAAANKDKHELCLLHQIRLEGFPEPERDYHFCAAAVGWVSGYRPKKGEARYRERLAQAGVQGLQDWRFDFAWPEHRIAVEIEGGLWMGPGKKGQKGGRHIDPRGYMEDMRKYREAAALDWIVFRFSGEEVVNLIAIRFLKVIFDPMNTYLQWKRKPWPAIKEEFGLSDP